MKYLEAKGQVAAMTKAASYLLSWESFSIMRDYLTGHVAWMVSDATGSRRSGQAGRLRVRDVWRVRTAAHPGRKRDRQGLAHRFESEPHRDLGFRFGYYDKPRGGHDHGDNHLVIMRRAVREGRTRRYSQNSFGLKGSDRGAELA